MPFDRSLIEAIIHESRSHSVELPWIEFKSNFQDPQTIGEYVSALSNTAALFNQAHGFLIWGINDSTHDITGTTFDPQKTKQGNQGLDLWIATQLEPQVQFYFHKVTIEGKNVVLLEVGAAYSTPVKFKGTDYIRIDSNKKKLNDFPDTERELWAALSKKPFETLMAEENLSEDFVLRLLDYSSYFDMLSLELPTNKAGILESLENDKMIVRSEAGRYNITNMGAILFARRISDFPSLERKAIRVIKYSGNSRTNSASKEQIGGKGYANGFEGLIGYINGLLPENEIMGKALRKKVPM